MDKKEFIEKYIDTNTNISIVEFKQAIQDLDNLINSVKDDCIEEIEKELREDYKNAFAVGVNKILTKIIKAIRDKE